MKKFKKRLNDSQREELKKMNLLSDVDLSIIKGGNPHGSGHFKSLSGDCNGSGSSCWNPKGFVDQFTYWLFE